MKMYRTAQEHVNEVGWLIFGSLIDAFLKTYLELWNNLLIINWKERGINLLWSI
jgi:hypothetical protein